MRSPVYEAVGPRPSLPQSLKASATVTGGDFGGGTPLLGDTSTSDPRRLRAQRARRPCRRRARAGDRFDTAHPSNGSCTPDSARARPIAASQAPRAPARLLHSSTKLAQISVMQMFAARSASEGVEKSASAEAPRALLASWNPTAGFSSQRRLSGCQGGAFARSARRFASPGRLRDRRPHHARRLRVDRRRRSGDRGFVEGGSRWPPPRRGGPKWDSVFLTGGARSSPRLQAHFVQRFGRSAVD